MNEAEKDNLIQNMLIIPYDNSTLGLAHTAHTLIHHVKDDNGNIAFGKDEIRLFDLRSKRIYKFEYKLTK